MDTEINKEIAIFVPCFVDQLDPQIGLNMVKIFEHLGFKVKVLRAAYCCGQPAYNSGFVAEAKEVGKRFLENFELWDGDIVVPGGSCVGFVRKDLLSLFDKPGQREILEERVERIYEFSEYLIDVLEVDLSQQMQWQGKVTYHDACGALRACGIKEAPRTLLNQIKGLEIIEMKEAETCCGFGGTFTVNFPEIAAGMAENKAQSTFETGVEWMVSTDASCFLHMKAYFEKQQYPIKTLHIVDLIAKSLNLMN